MRAASGRSPPSTCSKPPRLTNEGCFVLPVFGVDLTTIVVITNHLWTRCGSSPSRFISIPHRNVRPCPEPFPLPFHPLQKCALTASALPASFTSLTESFAHGLALPASWSFLAEMSAHSPAPSCFLFIPCRNVCSQPRPFPLPFFPLQKCALTASALPASISSLTQMSAHGLAPSRFLFIPYKNVRSRPRSFPLPFHPLQEGLLKASALPTPFSSLTQMSAHGIAPSRFLFIPYSNVRSRPRSFPLPFHPLQEGLLRASALPTPFSSLTQMSAHGIAPSGFLHSPAPSRFLFIRYRNVRSRPQPFLLRLHPLPKALLTASALPASWSFLAEMSAHRPAPSCFVFIPYRSVRTRPWPLPRHLIHYKKCPPTSAAAAAGRGGAPVARNDNTNNCDKDNDNNNRPIPLSWRL
jgi:hypothetical protein